ncbi:hypothetical protein QBC37DRAFT_458698 [Rhypophila decipiens]|uniref:Uncharacterized protein n=1 Tax=Rhypophila decipiens TaxID=261697 RepID=A0AAN7B7D1_9PEZI|nr:hypothetical protein QBC37DRAFT_458698 [Rhypophila decipiens]
MRPTPTFLLAFARLAAAACCRSNLCLREIVAEDVSDRNGLEDCSSYLAVTVTPDALTVYETVSEVPIEHTTKVETPFVTVSETVTVSTETVLVTVRTVSTATTEISLSTAVQTVIAATETRTATEFKTKTNAVDLKACQSFAKYKRACSCAGVTATTVVAASVEPTTITVTETGSAVLSTLLSAAPVVTETVTVPVVDTITDTTTEVDLLTATIASTTTTTVSLTSTVSTTSTQTASVCLKGALLGAFKANATQYGSSSLNIYANLLNGLTGGITWQAASSSTSASFQNKYIWALDEEGRLNVAYNVPPYTYKYYAYMSTASSGSNWPQVNTETSVRSQVNAGQAVTYITGCVDSVTGELTLNAAGRTQILWCGQQLWMSSNLGTDINRGVCVQMFPKVGRV